MAGCISNNGRFSLRQGIASSSQRAPRLACTGDATAVGTTVQLHLVDLLDALNYVIGPSLPTSKRTAVNAVPGMTVVVVETVGSVADLSLSSSDTLQSQRHWLVSFLSSLTGRRARGLR